MPADTYTPKWKGAIMHYPCCIIERSAKSCPINCRIMGFIFYVLENYIFFTAISDPFIKANNRIFWILLQLPLGVSVFIS